MNNPSKPQTAFGHNDLATQLAKRLHRHFDPLTPKDDAAFVIGLFGEWGSGKSYMLELVRQAFHEQDQEALAAGSPNTLTIIVPFNPWRYEKEPHLIVPLLKHLAQELEKITLIPMLDEKIKNKIVEGVSTLKNMCEAFFSGLNASGELDTKFFGKVGIDISGTDMLEKFESLQKLNQDLRDKANKPDGVHTLDSYYYQFDTHLRGIVEGNQAIDIPALNLLFLIDDLDRCLPEKAVEMLESIKLFLDVAGCAFVLAVDDEVVERGVLHRYRDYIFQDKNGRAMDSNAIASLPITGAEYLEKIIQLPFRLPLLHKAQIKDFLQSQYSDFFTQAAEADSAVNGELDKTSLDTARQSLRDANNVDGTLTAEQAQNLIHLFSTHVPFVPRKLIRTVELYRLLVGTAVQRKAWQHLDHEVLGIMVLLQLYAPDVYRYAQKHYDNLLQLLASWAGNEGFKWTRQSFINNWDFTPKEQGEIDAYFSQSPSSNPEEHDLYKDIRSRQNDRGNYEAYYHPIITKLNQARDARSGFNPYRLISQTLPAIQRVTAQASNDPDVWKMYFSLTESDAVLKTTGVRPVNEESYTFIFDARQQAVLSEPTAFWDALFSNEPANWNRALEQIDVEKKRLSDADFITLKTKLNPDSQVKDPKYWQRIELLYPALGAEQVKELTLQQQVIELIAKPLASSANIPTIHARAAAGRVLSLVGDTRKGVGFITTDNPLALNFPQFEWVTIPAGSFTMGSVKDDKLAYKNESQHEVSVKAFQISAYPVTNAQYACFVTANTNHPPPKYWNDVQWNAANHPVVGVSWTDANAYVAWLNDSQKSGVPLLNKNWMFALATEQEWEYAARGKESDTYPWGNEAITPTRANYADTKLNRTTAVGLFAANKHFNAPIYDQIGNVWEWTASVYADKAGQAQQKNSNTDTSYVIRGGAWYYNPRGARAADRLRDNPDVRNDSLGFRLVCRPI